MTSHGITSTLRRPDVTSSGTCGRWRSEYHWILSMVDRFVRLAAAAVAYIGVPGPDRSVRSDRVHEIVPMATPLPG
jgi:hypothetical protein